MEVSECEMLQTQRKMGEGTNHHMKKQKLSIASSDRNAVEIKMNLT
jgi:hypothetical protein